MKTSLLWVTDPWSTLDQAHDTTLRLAQEALNLGLNSYWSSEEFLLDAPRGMLRVLPSEAAGDRTRSLLVPTEQIHQLHYRVDPPVNASYRDFLDRIRAHGVSDSRILNPPEVILNQSEKLPPRDLLHLAPPHCVITGLEDVAEAYRAAGSMAGFVTKPMNQAQSIGVKRHSDRGSLESFTALLESETQGFQSPLLLETFLPGIANGEVRLWFSAGRFIAALKKYPKEGDFRVLIDEGSRVLAHVLDSRELEIAGEIGESLHSQGIGLAAIDLIDGWISDYNLTSPGLLVQLEKVHGGRNFAKEVLDSLLKGF